MTDERAQRGKGFVIKSGVPLRCRQVGSQRATDLDGAHRPTAARATTVVLDQLTQRGAEGNLDQTAAFDVPPELHGEGAAGTRHAVAPVGFGAFAQNGGNGNEAEHVVDQRGLAEEPLDGRQRRLGAHRATTPLENLEQGCLFTADIRTCAYTQFHVEGTPAAHHIGTEPAISAGNLDGATHHDGRLRVLDAQTDKALVSAGGKPCDRHAFQQLERVGLKDKSIRKGARISLLGVADNELLGRRRVQHGLPLDAGGERRSTTTAQARGFHGINDLLLRERERVAQSHQPALATVVLERQRVDATDTPETHPLLAQDPRVRIHRTDAARMARCETAGDQ